MDKIMKILKGILVGLGGILPGVSGGMIAASFNVYEELIEALNQFTKKPFKAIISIWEYLLGIVLGVLIGIVVIATIFVVIPIPITFLFIGLILGGIPTIVKELRVEKLNWKHYLVIIMFMIVMVGLLFLKPMTQVDLGVFKYILTGFLIAISLIVPGLSGTMILLALGIYDFVIVETIKGFLEALVSFNFETILSLLPSILIIGISGLATLLLVSKPISYVFKNKHSYFNMAVLGILIVSPINILYSLYNDNKYSDHFNNINALVIISSLLLLVIGYILAIKLANKKEVEEGVSDDVK